MKYQLIKRSLKKKIFEKSILLLFLKDKRETVKCKISKTGSIGQKYLFRDISLFEKKKNGEGDIPLKSFSQHFHVSVSKFRDQIYKRVQQSSR